MLRFPIHILGGACLALTLATPALAQDSAPILQTSLGPVSGIVDGGSFSYRGIPFAAPPTGENRWRAPQDPTPWTTLRSGAEFGSSCLQTGTDESGISGGEDCLYLNVWRPAGSEGEALPVMFWIHGGANIVGSSDQSGYNGARLAAENNVVVVSTNYRLGFLGFFNHEALHSGDPKDDSGSFALLDQMKALEWVQDNAEAIGGDRERVTIFGESAGGMNSWSLIMSPLADGLFHRAIIESGCPLFIPLDEARRSSASTVEALVINDGLASDVTAAQAYIAAQGEAWVRDYLYGKPAEEIFTVLEEGESVSLVSYYGIEDGYLLPTNALNALVDGDFTGVPAIIGANRDEMKLFMFLLYGMGPVAYNQAMSSVYGETASEVEALYPRRDYQGSDHYYNRFTDMADGFLETACGTGGALWSSEHMPVWFYRFAYDGLIEPFDAQIGAGHAMELPFVFGTFMEDLYPPETLAVRQALSTEMQNAWTCFAAGNAPDACGGRFEWPAFKASGTGSLQRIIWDEGIELGRVPQSEIDKVNYWAESLGYELGRLPMSVDPRALRLIGEPEGLLR